MSLNNNEFLSLKTLDSAKSMKRKKKINYFWIFPKRNGIITSK